MKTYWTQIYISEMIFNHRCIMFIHVGHTYVEKCHYQSQVDQVYETHFLCQSQVGQVCTATCSDQSQVSQVIINSIDSAKSSPNITKLGHSTSLILTTLHFCFVTFEPL